MSYDGYSQLLCKSGHYWIKDCNLMSFTELSDNKCPKCEEPAVWENMVNVTNGIWDDDGTRIDGYIELKIKSQTSGVCSACGEKHICETRYFIPKNKKEVKETK